MGILFLVNQTCCHLFGFGFGFWFEVVEGLTPMSQESIGWMKVGDDDGRTEIYESIDRTEVAQRGLYEGEA